MRIGWIHASAAPGAAQMLVIALLVAYAATYALFSAPFDGQSRGADFAAYWNAAERMRLGEPLYPPLGDQQANDVYRYSAWFAFAWLPLTLLPRELNAWVGQVHTLLVAALVLTLRGKSGPVVVGIAASLKLSPLAFAAWYAVRQEWGRAAVAMGVFVMLAATTLPFNLSHYPTAASEMSLASVSGSASIVATGVAICIAGWIGLTQPRYRLLAAAVIAAIALPRVHHISMSWLIPAISERDE